MRTIIEAARELPVLEYDVFVAGAGTAGCIAAIAAARAGARVLLVEKLPVPGGTYTNGGIGTYSYFASCGPGEASRRIVGGLPFELAERLEAEGGATGFLPTPGDKHRIPSRFVADHEVYKGVISELLLDSGVDVLLQTQLAGLICSDGRISCAVIENKDGRRAAAAKVFIDATGDGDAARHAGCPQLELWQEYTGVCGAPTGLVFGMAGVDFDRLLEENPGAAFLLSDDTTDAGERVRRIAFTHMREPQKYAELSKLDINYFTTIQSIHEGEATYINNSKGVVTDGSGAENLSAAELAMRLRIMRMAQALRSCVPGFERAHLSWASTQLGVRASRITVCDKMLSQAELSAAARFEDEIGLYGFHDLSPKRPECEIGAPGFYGLPYRMLLPCGCANLLMAGRCVTADVEAHMSTRNTVCCMVMGQAAGVAAALCAEGGLEARQLPYGRLRAGLLAQGAILEA